MIVVQAQVEFSHEQSLDVAGMFGSVLYGLKAVAFEVGHCALWRQRCSLRIAVPVERCELGLLRRVHRQHIFEGHTP